MRSCSLRLVTLFCCILMYLVHKNGDWVIALGTFLPDVVLSLST